MPMGQYENFADCVRKNQDKSDPQAYCGAIQKQTENTKMSDTTKKKVMYNGKEYFVMAENQKFTITASLNRKEELPSVTTTKNN